MLPSAPRQPPPPKAMPSPQSVNPMLSAGESQSVPGDPWMSAATSPPLSFEDQCTPHAQAMLPSAPPQPSPPKAMPSPQSVNPVLNAGDSQSVPGDPWMSAATSPPLSFEDQSRANKLFCCMCGWRDWSAFSHNERKWSTYSSRWNLS